MSGSKLHLSPEEMKLMTDPGVILTKNSVMTKVVGMMAGLSEEYKLIWAPGATVGASGTLAHEGAKISRGENYEGLPWVMLDYPRFFGREDVFAIRTMFWWGHNFTVTLHLKGKYKHRYLPVLEAQWATLAAAGFHVGVSDDEWRHEHVPGNYEQIGGAGDLRKGEFLKLSAAVDLGRWAEASGDLAGMFKTLIDVLGQNRT